MTHALPLFLITCGPASPRLLLGIEQAKAAGHDVHHHDMGVAFRDLYQPQPAAWRRLKDALEGRNEGLAVWAGDSLVLAAPLCRAFTLAHRPDFLWPLPLYFDQSGGVVSKLFPCVSLSGAFDLAQYSVRDLGGFHHAVQARALFKLLSVEKAESLNIPRYFLRAWGDFDSARTPDHWLITAEECGLNWGQTPIEQSGTRQMDEAMIELYQRVDMGREALHVKSRNAVMMADYIRTNPAVVPADATPSTLAAQYPYYGFWPVKMGNMTVTVPCIGTSRPVDDTIWGHGYRAGSSMMWDNLCKGKSLRVHDLTQGQEGRVFSLLALLAHPQTTVTLPAMDAAIVNLLGLYPHLAPRVHVADAPPSDSLVLLHAHDPHITALASTHSLFILSDSAAEKEALPAHLPIPPNYLLCGFAEARRNVSNIEPAQIRDFEAIITLAPAHHQLINWEQKS